ncbi:MAG: hypothetical protein JWM28_1004 [Chitinophagaceae bacterium]|nr:hypothetical protein [Chitinophagaceae bacterium]
MSSLHRIQISGIQFIRIICYVIFLFSFSIPAHAQFKIFPVQNISFGAFYPGSNGGSVIISANGTRSVTGTVVPLNLGIQFCQAIFDIEAPQGTIVSILNGSDIVLSGSNGGSMSFHIGNSQPANPFSTSQSPPARTPVNIGGTLSVGSAMTNPAGSYTGTFAITFNWQ